MVPETAVLAEYLDVETALDIGAAKVLGRDCERLAAVLGGKQLS